MVKTIQLREGANTYVLSSDTEISGINLITFVTEKMGAQAFPRACGEGVAGGDNRMYQENIEVEWVPKTDDTYPSSGKCKEEKVTDVRSAQRTSDETWYFDWGVGAEQGARTFTIILKQVIEMETGGEVPVSTVKLVLMICKDVTVW